MDDQTESPLVTNNFCSVYTNHGIYKMKNRSPYEYIPFYARLPFDIRCIGLLDSGSTHSLIPSCLLPQAILDKLDKSSETFTGITSNSTHAVGCFTTTIYLCGISLPNITFHVMPTSCPLLLGQDILRHKLIRSYTIDHVTQTLRLQLASGLAVGELTTGPSNIKMPKTNRQVNLNMNMNIEDGLPEIEDNDYEPPKIVPKSDPANLKSCDEKVQWLKSELNMHLEHHDKKELEMFADLVIENKAVFGVGKNNLGKFPKEVRIPTNGTPRSAKGNHISEAHQPLVKTEIEKMLAAGVIERCEDPKGFNSPLVVIKKKDGTLRVCCNFKPTLNQCLVDPDPFPMASTDEVFRQFKPGDKYFSSMDLLKGYWQCVLAKEDRYKTAFTFEGVTYCFIRLPFGLTTAGNSFSRQLAEVLQECLRQCKGISYYLDDIAIHSDNFTDFIEAHRKVFKALISNGGKLKPEKCEFLRPKIKFLGRIVSARGMEPDPDHIQGIQDMKPPKTKRQLASLVGRLHWLSQFIGCRMHEKVKATGYSALMEPIYELYRNQKKTFHWTPEADKAFENIKKRLSSAPFISFSDPRYPYTLTTDASNYGAAGILMQQREGKYHVIAAISKTFSPVQSRWSATEREAWAIVWAAGKLSHFLLDKAFVIFTDHKSLQFIDRKEFNNAKIQNWSHKLSRFQFTVQYLEGKSNVFADWLSRADDAPPKQPCDNSAAGKFYALPDSPLRFYIPSWCENLVPKAELKLEMGKDENFCAHIAPAVFLSERPATDEALNFKVLQYLEIAKAQREDLFLARIIKNLANDASGPSEALVKSMDSNSEKHGKYANIADSLYLDSPSGVLMVRRKGKISQIVIPQSLRRFYLHSAHVNQTAHSGRRRVSDCLDHYFWEGKEADIVSFIESCELCTNRKGRYGQRPIPNGHNIRGSRPFECLYIDYIAMPQVRGLKCALTVLCPFTKWLEVFPLAHDTAINTARCIARVILKHRIVPEVISSDRGRHFTGAIFQEMCKQLGIKLNLHVSWRPQSTGCLERAHRTLKNSLFIMALERNTDWVEILPYVVSALNNCSSTATGCSPFYAVYGRKGNIELPGSPVSQMLAKSPLDYGHQVSNCLKQAHHAIQKANKEADSVLDQRIARTSSKCSLEVGHKVCLYRPHAAGNTHRMPWLGKFKILATNGLVAKITDESTGWTDWVHCTHIKRIIDRPDEFILPQFKPEFKIHPMPAAPVLSSGRGDVPSLPIPSSTRPVTVPPPSNMPQAPPAPKPSKKIAKTAPFRASGRIRNPVEKLQIDPKKKSYATYADCLRNCFLPHACPSPIQSFTRA